jgi:hypothetical protein
MSGLTKRTTYCIYGQPGLDIIPFQVVQQSPVLCSPKQAAKNIHNHDEQYRRQGVTLM